MKAIKAAMVKMAVRIVFMGVLMSAVLLLWGFLTGPDSGRKLKKKAASTKPTGMIVERDHPGHRILKVSSLELPRQEGLSVPFAKKNWY